MGTRKWYVGTLLAVVVVGAVLAALLWGSASQAEEAYSAPAVPPDASLALVQSSEVAAAAGDPLILSYAAKFVCIEPLQPGQVSYSPVAPIVAERTEVLIHNPNDYPVVFFKKAVRAPLEDLPPIEPGPWKELVLEPDHAVRVNCDDIASLLTGEQGATFVGKFGIGVKVEGFVVAAIGPNAAGTPERLRYSFLDVTAEYSRSSEVLKKDIRFQPWWWYWRWPLPWRLGYPYQRLIPIDAATNIDCRGNLVQALHDDVEKDPSLEPDLKAATHLALDEGLKMYPASEMSPTGEEGPPALVAMIGRCDKLDPTTAAVDYVLLSNKGPTDLQPTGREPTQPEQVFPYPWIPGRWYDLTVVVPQNMSIDLDDYMRQWYTNRWLETGADQALVTDAMFYFFPYHCGWGYWWWWWHGGDCIDIGVGEGESIDVEQITPVRVIMSEWPPPIVVP